MKLTNKIALISGLGCLALVGSGFAAWTYTESVETPSTAVGTVTAIKTVGTIAVENTLAFTIDQDASKTGHVGKFVWTGTVTPTYTKSSDHEAVALTYTVDGSQFGTTYFTVSAKIANWVSGTAYQGDDLVTVNWVKDIPTAADYDAMYTALNGKTLTITFKAANTIA